MVPLRLPYERRGRRSEVRIISSTALSVQMNQFLNFFPEIIQGTAEGFERVDGEGRPGKIFLGICGILEIMQLHQKS